MKLKIEHELLYEYSDAVHLEPHYLYLQPKENSLLALKSYQLEIDPQPDFLANNLDATDNTQQIIFFSKPSKKLQIKATSIIETTEFNPLSFVYHPFENSQLPIQYNDRLQQMLLPYLTKDGITTLIDQTARQIAGNVNWNTTSFLTELNRFINGFAYEIREEGQPNSPEITLLSQTGSCRDYSVLFMSMCRVMGIAARFVSGYYFATHAENPDEEQYLHAWVEVYLPGGGWRGFDPTQNCLVSGKHVPVGTSAISEMVTPVHGTYRGSASSTFQTKVKLVQI
ncbi:MAG: transglutaminase family protein [Bacteroidota bacterium]|jgi:transglutaminase-like putative cysteine protease